MYTRYVHREHVWDFVVDHVTRGESSAHQVHDTGVTRFVLTNSSAVHVDSFRLAPELVTKTRCRVIEMIRRRQTSTTTFGVE